MDEVHHIKIQIQITYEGERLNWRELLDEAVEDIIVDTQTSNSPCTLVDLELEEID